MKTTRSFLFALLFNVALLVPLLLPPSADCLGGRLAGSGDHQAHSLSGCGCDGERADPHRRGQGFSARLFFAPF